MAIIRWTLFYIVLFCLAALAAGSLAIPGLTVIIVVALLVLFVTSRARRVLRRRTWFGDAETNRELARLDEELCEEEAAERRRRRDELAS